jgi:hypothetical protein
MSIKFEKLNGWWVLQLDAQVSGNLAQAVVQMWKVVEGHVADEGASNFVVAGAAVQPAQKDKQLKA